MQKLKLSISCKLKIEHCCCCCLDYHPPKLHCPNFWWRWLNGFWWILENVVGMNELGMFLLLSWTYLFILILGRFKVEVYSGKANFQIVEPIASVKKCKCQWKDDSWDFVNLGHRIQCLVWAPREKKEQQQPWWWWFAWLHAAVLLCQSSSWNKPLWSITLACMQARVKDAE